MCKRMAMITYYTTCKHDYEIPVIERCDDVVESDTLQPCPPDEMKYGKATKNCHIFFCPPCERIDKANGGDGKWKGKPAGKGGERYVFEDEVEGGDGEKGGDGKKGGEGKKGGAGKKGEKGKKGGDKKKGGKGKKGEDKKKGGHKKKHGGILGLLF